MQPAFSLSLCFGLIWKIKGKADMHFKIFAHTSESSTILVLRSLRQNVTNSNKDSLCHHLLFYSCWVHLPVLWLARNQHRNSNLILMNIIFSFLYVTNYLHFLLRTVVLDSRATETEEETWKTVKKQTVQLGIYFQTTHEANYQEAISTLLLVSLNIVQLALTPQAVNRSDL